MRFDLIEAGIEKNSEKAYTSGDKSYTYGELKGYISALQGVLLSLDNSKPVIIYGSKEIHMKAGITACLFSDIAYVPVDSSFPENRAREIIEASKPSLIIGDFEYGGVKTLTKNEINALFKKQSGSEIVFKERDENSTAYIIFTSGSTGKPKGVVVSCKNLSSCISWLDTFVSESRCVLNQAKLSFDLSVADFYLSLIKGAEHFALCENELKSFPLLFKRLGESGADMAVMTPSFAEMLLLDRDFNSSLMPRLKTIIFCGETLKVKTVKKLFSRFEGLNVINCYGPSEATFAVTSVKIKKEDLALPSLPVGAPKNGVEIFCDESGEIIIAGDSVSKGYLPPADSSAFFTYKNMPAYKTGDYGEIKNGMLWFSGRRDSQIKLSGFRIETGDIEENLLKIDGIAAAAVAPKRMKNGAVKSINAFAVLEKGVNKTESEIIAELKKQLPPYMIPKLKITERIPLNENGKCDFKKLMGEEL